MAVELARKPNTSSIPYFLRRAADDRGSATAVKTEDASINSETKKHGFNASSEEQEEVAEEGSRAKRQRRGEGSSNSAGHIKEEEMTAEALDLDGLEVYVKKEEN